MPYTIESHYVRFDHPEGAPAGDIIAELEDLVQNPAYKRQMNCLVDLRSLPKAPETPDIKDIAGHYGTIRDKIGPKIAFIVKSSLEFGMIRMFGSLMEGYGFEVRIFETEDEALIWLLR